MKRTILTFVVTTTLMAGTILTGCQTSGEKLDDAKSNVQDAKQDLKEAQKEVSTEALNTANAAEWKVFKQESEVKIRNNEVRVAELKVKLKKPGKTFDALYEKRIEKLDQKNKDLKTRIDAYENKQSDWQAFKSEFNQDLDELGQALKDFTVDNK